ncbi:MAG: glucose-1-phosphate adenylyltransferase, partial [Saprospiraceae bacterium]|nr:glucose-1-phosphate adenylyltransferase [Saprospiraceae bacterium]
DDIIDFIEKPGIDILDEWKSPLGDEYLNQGKEYLASMGIYIFNRKVLMDLFDEMPEANDFGKEIIPNSVRSEKYKAISFPFGGYWTDIGSIKSYFEANLTLTKFLPQFNLFDNHNHVYTSARMLSPSKVFDTRLKHTLISDGCIIHAEVIKNSIVGIRSRIGQRTVIESSIIMGNDYYQALEDLSEASQTKVLGIGMDCFIERTIADKNVKIGNNVKIVGHDSLDDHETDLYAIREGIIILKKGVTIPDNTVIGYTEN